MDSKNISNKAIEKAIKNANSEKCTALQSRKVALIKKHEKRVLITILFASIFSLSIFAGYVGTFLLFK